MPVKKGTSEPTRRSTRKITMASTKRPRKTKAGAKVGPGRSSVVVPKDVEPDLPESEESAASTPEPPAPSSSRKIKSPPAEEPAVVVAGPSIRSTLFEPPPQIPSDDPSAVFWAPFDNSFARDLIPLFIHKPPPPSDEQIRSLALLTPVLSPYRREHPNLPLNVEAFLWALARAARHIAKVLPDVAAAEELIALYRDLRPSSEIQDTILAADPKGTHYGAGFCVPSIVTVPTRRPRVPAFSDSEESDSEEPPAKRPRMAISPSPGRSPTPAPPSERSMTPVGPIFDITTRAQLINMFFDIPETGMPSPAHMKIPTSYVQTSLVPPMLSKIAFPCLNCVLNYAECRPVGGRSSVCTRCADRKHQCSHNWTPLEFKRFAECMRPFIAVAPHTIAAALQRLVQAYEDAQFASFAHVRALNNLRLQAQDSALTISGAERSLAVEQFNDFFVDKEGADLARDFVAHVLSQKPFYELERDFVAHEATSGAIPVTNAAGDVESYTYQPKFSARLIPDLDLQGVLKTVDPKLGPVASFDDLSSAGPSSSKLAPATSTPAAKPSTPPPTFGPAPLLETPAPSSSKARHGKGIATPSSVDKGKGVDRG
ncbi:hypothetical protein R3P38DRAFT_3206429 [Favolaschia claudopus]|uniref:Uncharacterized protein n=1 Tax=Favolaschia claudopus TaxID=2862362 RepID=A0AAW0AM54_9AGAR